MHRRRTIPIRALLATVLSTALAWQYGSRFSEATHVRKLESEQWYSVDVTETGAVLELDFDHSARYAILVGNLDDASHAADIRLTATPISAAAPFAGHPLESLSALVGKKTPATAVPPMLAVSRIPGRTAKSGSPPPSSASKETSRPFFLHVTEGPLNDPRQYVRIEGKPLAEGRKVRVYLDGTLAADDLFPGTAAEIVRLMDEEIIPRTRAVLGTHRDIDGDGKFAILLTPWLDRLQGGRTSLGGMVRGDDFRMDRDAPFGNRADMMFLNSNTRPGSHLRTLLIHEFAHAVCFSVRQGSEAAPIPLPPEEDWLNEAIAHVSEHLHEGGWSNLDYRISRFLDEPGRYPLVVEDYYGSGLWRSHGCRGGTFLFLRWCVDRFGEDVLRRLARGPYSGRRNLEHATGVPFPELYRRWTIALHESGRRSGLRGPGSKSPGSENPMSSTKSRTDGLCSLDLRAPVEEWGLCGPRSLEWNVERLESEGREKTIALRRTTSAFVELHGSKHTGSRRIRIRAENGARLQVSVRRLDETPAAWNSTAEWLDANATSGPTESPLPRLAVTLSLAREISGAHETTGGRPFEVEYVACEINEGERHRSHCLHGDELRQVLRKSRTSGDGVSISSHRIEFPIPFPLEDGEMLTVKAVVSDATGRRSIARTEIRVPISRTGIELAGHADSATMRR